MMPVVKKLTAKARDIRDLCLIPWWGRFPGGGHDNPLQYSGLENPYGQRNLADYSPQGHKKSDMTEATQHACVHTIMVLTIYLLVHM